MQQEHFVCPECGEHVAADEDNCCATCGEDCAVEPCHCIRDRDAEIARLKIQVSSLKTVLEVARDWLSKVCDDPEFWKALERARVGLPAYDWPDQCTCDTYAPGTCEECRKVGA